MKVRSAVCFFALKYMHYHIHPAVVDWCRRRCSLTGVIHQITRVVDNATTLTQQRRRSNADAATQTQQRRRSNATTDGRTGVRARSRRRTCLATETSEAEATDCSSSTNTAN